MICSQNHDQVGNRAAGERLSALISFEALKLAAGATLLAPFLPLLFMGEEYGEPAPFQYFTSHGDHDLVEAVRRGRRQEFASFGWEDSVPDPQAEQTFQRSRLNLLLKQEEPYKTLYRLYQELIRIRRDLRLGSRESRVIRELGERGLLLRYPGHPETAVLFNFADRTITMNLPELAGNWAVLLNSAGESWRGPDAETASSVNISPESRLGIFLYSFLLLQRVE